MDGTDRPVSKERMSTTSTPRRSPFGRSRGDDGPRATFRELLPYLFEHKGPLWAALILGLFGALASLAQPLLVSQVIQLVEKVIRSAPSCGRSWRSS